MTFRLGLTGSIGMGKSTTAQMFVAQGCALWDADDVVAKMYGPGGAAVAPISALIDDVVRDGALDRDVLRAAIRHDRDILAKIEAIVHPLVRAHRENFANLVREDIAVFDIPLLFETGAETQMDAVACVTVSPELQRKRVLERGTMSASDLDVILAKQMPNAQKCARSDYIIETETLEQARATVHSIVQEIRSKNPHA
ncbi:dephospho-CoA kinase [Roseobacteraceae bacterium S113]